MERVAGVLVVSDRKVTVSEADRKHREATAAYAEASAAYEAAAMSEDHSALVEADQRLREADSTYGETAAAWLASLRRRDLPSFEEMLAHPWTQPDPDGIFVGAIKAHAHDWTKHPISTVGATPVWTCTCGLYATNAPE